jgi:membrane-bound lytic murein transglycosylase D
MFLALGPSLAAVACATTATSSRPQPEQPVASAAPARDGAPAPSAETAAASGSNQDAVSPASREVTPDRTRREVVPVRVREIREQMDEEYQAGLEAYQAGRFDEAKEHFDRAVDLVITSDINLDEQPALKRAYDEIVRNIADMDADLYSRESEPEGQENRSPLDELKDITTHLPPEEAEKERDKIQQMAGKISYDLPIVLHPKVLQYVEAFQTRLRDEFEPGLQRSGLYLPMIKKIFREEGLPEDLAYMAHQESAFKTNAYSRARARGMWQFMSFTGRRYGLKVDLWVDERGDFEKATRAAAAYLKDLYARYNDWYLAMAAYNAGEGKIDRACAHARTHDFWALTKTRYIRPETKYYVPAILASILIDKSPEDYGFRVEIADELSWDTVTLDRATDLQVIADATGATLERIRFLNPELRGLVTPPNAASYTVRVPEGTKKDLLVALETLPDEQRVSWTLHEVRSGETFQTIARTRGVQTRALLDANPRYAGRRLRRGQVLNVPLAKGSPEVALARASEDPTFESGERVVHRVRRGETLASIGRDYRTTVANLKRWNSLNGSLIQPGQRLIAYYGERGSGPREAQPAAVSVAGGRIEYQVQAGDTLDSVARKFSASLDDICRWNGLTPDSVVRPGDMLHIGEAGGQGGVTGPEALRKGGGSSAIRHRVRRGDTLLKIAQMYDVTVRQVRTWNGLRSSVIYPGQVLTIRGK